MSRLATLALAAAVLCGCAPQGPLDEVASLERARFAAMVRQDVAALAPMLAPDLVYCHSNGRCEGRDQFLETIRSGAIRYRGIEVVEMRPRTVAGAVVVHGVVDVDGELGGRAARMRLVYTDVYVDRQGRWQLAAWHSTRLPES